MLVKQMIFVSPIYFEIFKCVYQHLQLKNHPIVLNV